MLIDLELNDLKNIIQKNKEQLFLKKGIKNQLIKDKNIKENEYYEAINKEETFEKVKILLLKTSELTRDIAKKKIEEFVTSCLQYVFENDVVFAIEINEIKNSPDAEFFLINKINGEEFKTRPEESRGGGVVDIISIALRIAMILVISYGENNILILDEPAKHVSEEYIFKVGQFLKKMASKFKKQLIIVSHNKILSNFADKNLKVELINDKSLILFEA